MLQGFMAASLFGLAIGLAAMQPQDPHRNLLDAIRSVESMDGKRLVGDDGKAIGPYQIHEVYWRDAVRHQPSIGGAYRDCMDKDYSERIVRAYWDRYAPSDASDETLARIHNGGPNGAGKPATLPYWSKVKAKMERHDA